ncbi:MAG: tetraacyldisaccharide 4'-kinase [Parvularculaceae bacterium]
MTEPWFWREDSMAARAARMTLMPAAMLYDAGQLVRGALARPVDPGVPVLCVGNATTGGVGKTPFALMLQRLLAADGIEAAFVSRGYGGSLTGPVRVTPQHTAQEVGDEPLLLASAAPTWIAKTRAGGVVAAAAAGAKLLIMDDGFQNPTVKKTLSFLLLGGDEHSLAPFPAGPLREPLARAVARADAVVQASLPSPVYARQSHIKPRFVRPSPARGRGANACVGRGEGPYAERSALVDAPSPCPLPQAGEGSASDAIALPVYGRGATPRFQTHTDISPSIAPQPVIALCGIARPERFFHALEEKGFTLAGRAAFPDHHAFSTGDLADLRRRAKAAGAALITTEKDLVRLTLAEREGIAVARLTMSVDDPQRLMRFICERISL